MYSYDEDSMVLDPKLSDHLSHFGINMMTMSKVSESCNTQVSKNCILMLFMYL